MASDLRASKVIQSHERKHLIAVGACYIDTILSVPHFPAEDSKLRTTSYSRRRGGNCPNTVEVFRQIMRADETHQAYKFIDDDDFHVVTIDGSCQAATSLICTLPEQNSLDTRFIAESFIQSIIGGPQNTEFDLTGCVYRELCPEAASSYIIRSLANGSRTIVNHNALPEMTFEEFRESVKDIMTAEDCSPSHRQIFWPTRSPEETSELWFHFEGRIPETTAQCMSWLRLSHDDLPYLQDKSIKISVEVEKPGREGLQQLIYLSDVAIISRSWAGGQGYEDGETCIRDQMAKCIRLRNAGRSCYTQAVVCTWGDGGSHGARLTYDTQGQTQILHAPAVECKVVDSIGAGDSWNAAVLYAFMCRNVLGGRRIDDIVPHDEAIKKYPVWDLATALGFANDVAAHKLEQEGFRDLECAIKNSLQDWKEDLEQRVEVH